MSVDSPGFRAAGRTSPAAPATPVPAEQARMLINLHSHLEGRVRPATAAAIAREIGMPDADRDWEAALQLDGPADLTTYLLKVVASFPFFSRLDHLERITREAVEDAAADGEDYLELRFGPASHAATSTDLDAVIAAACRGARDGTAATGMPAGIVVAALRSDPTETNEAVARAAARAAGSGVVGFDLAGDEKRFPGLEPFTEAFGIASAAGLGLTCHAAEAAPGDAAVAAVEMLGVTRIGHGARIAQQPAGWRRRLDERERGRRSPADSRASGAWDASR